MIRHHRGNRRFTTQCKAQRKARIVHEQNDYWHYKYFGMYRKGKIHCSCPMCSSKTNASINKSKGSVYEAMIDDGNSGHFTGRRGCRLSTTNERFGKKNWKHSDRKKISEMLDQLEDECYLEEYEDY